MIRDIENYQEKESQHTVEFDELNTEKFRKRMQPYIDETYQQIWQGCKIERFEGNNLDKYLGIDVIIHLPDYETIYTLQEKIRENKFLTQTRYQVIPGIPDFTQEYKNAVGTGFERDGEWCHLSAQLYWYGWANKAENDIEKWVLFNVATYKRIVIAGGGLNRIGSLRNNSEHGKASFYAIPVTRLKKAWITSKAHLELRKA